MDYEYGTINPDGTGGDVTIYNTGYYGIYIQTEIDLKDNYLRFWIRDDSGNDREYAQFPTGEQILNYIAQMNN